MAIGNSGGGWWSVAVAVGGAGKSRNGEAIYSEKISRFLMQLKIRNNISLQACRA